MYIIDIKKKKKIKRKIHDFILIYLFCTKTNRHFTNIKNKDLTFLYRFIFGTKTNRHFTTQQLFSSTVLRLQIWKRTNHQVTHIVHLLPISCNRSLRSWAVPKHKLIACHKQSHTPTYRKIWPPSHWTLFSMTVPSAVFN